MNLILIRGLPGSGKTTLALSMVKEGHAECHFEADQFFVKDGEYQFNPRLIGDAHAVCQFNTREALKAGSDVVVSNTFTEFWEMAPYFYMAKEFRANVTVIECQGSWENIHGVPAASIQRMKDRWQEYTK